MNLKYCNEELDEHHYYDLPFPVADDINSFLKLTLKQFKEIHCKAMRCQPINVLIYDNKGFVYDDTKDMKSLGISLQSELYVRVFSIPTIITHYSIHVFKTEDLQTKQEVKNENDMNVEDKVLRIEIAFNSLLKNSLSNFRPTFKSEVDQTLIQLPDMIENLPEKPSDVHFIEKKRNFIDSYQKHALSAIRERSREISNVIADAMKSNSFQIIAEIVAYEIDTIEEIETILLSDNIHHKEMREQRLKRKAELIEEQEQQKKNKRITIDEREQEYYIEKDESDIMCEDIKPEPKRYLEINGDLICLNPDAPIQEKIEMKADDQIIEDVLQDLGKLPDANYFYLYCPLNTTTSQLKHHISSILCNLKTNQMVLNYGNHPLCLKDQSVLDFVQKKHLLLYNTYKENLSLNISLSYMKYQVIVQTNFQNNPNHQWIVPLCEQTKRLEKMKVLDLKMIMRDILGLKLLTCFVLLSGDNSRPSAILNDKESLFDLLSSNVNSILYVEATETVKQNETLFTKGVYYHQENPALTVYENVLLNLLKTRYEILNDCFCPVENFKSTLSSPYRKKDKQEDEEPQYVNIKSETACFHSVTNHNNSTTYNTFSYTSNTFQNEATHPAVSQSYIQAHGKSWYAKYVEKKVIDTRYTCTCLNDYTPISKKQYSIYRPCPECLTVHVKNGIGITSDDTISYKCERCDYIIRVESVIDCQPEFKSGEDLQTEKNEAIKSNLSNTSYNGKNDGLLLSSSTKEFIPLHVGSTNCMMQLELDVAETLDAFATTIAKKDLAAKQNIELLFQFYSPNLNRIYEKEVKLCEIVIERARSYMNAYCSGGASIPNFDKATYYVGAWFVVASHEVIREFVVERVKNFDNNSNVDVSVYEKQQKLLQNKFRINLYILQKMKKVITDKKYIVGDDQVVQNVHRFYPSFIKGVETEDTMATIDRKRLSRCIKFTCDRLRMKNTTHILAEVFPYNKLINTVDVDLISQNSDFRLLSESNSDPIKTEIKTEQELKGNNEVNKMNNLLIVKDMISQVVKELYDKVKSLIECTLSEWKMYGRGLLYDLRWFKNADEVVSFLLEGNEMMIKNRIIICLKIMRFVVGENKDFTHKISTDLFQIKTSDFEKEKDKLLRLATDDFKLAAHHAFVKRTSK